VGEADQADYEKQAHLAPRLKEAGIKEVALLDRAGLSYSAFLNRQKLKTSSGRAGKYSASKILSRLIWKR